MVGEDKERIRQKRFRKELDKDKRQKKLSLSNPKEEYKRKRLTIKDIEINDEEFNKP